MNQKSSMEEQFIERLNQILEKNLDNEKFDIPELAKEIGISRATLQRKIKNIKNKTTGQFIKEFKLERAKQLLEKRVGTVSEISYLVGFGSTTYFTKCFHEHFGFPPGTVLKENHPKNGNNNNVIKPKSYVIAKSISAIVLIIAGIFINSDISIIHTTNKSSVNPKKLTDNQAALNAYNQGINLMKVYVGSQNEEHFLEAKSRFENAIKLDTTFGDAYARVANIYFSHIPFSPKTNKGFHYADSGRIYLEKAEKFGVVDSDFFLRMKSHYLQRQGKFQEAFQIFEELWKDKERDYNYFHEKGNHGFHARNYNVGIENLIKYLNLKPDSILPIYDRLQKLSIMFSLAGFQNEAQEFAFRQFELTKDSLRYWIHYPIITFECGNFKEAIKTYEKDYDSKNVSWTVYNKLMEIYLLTGKHKDALKLLPEFIDFCNTQYKKEIPNYLLGYYHYLNGEKELAQWHFKEVIKQLEYFCSVNKFQQSIPNYLTIASCYSMLNDKTGVIESLEKLWEKTSIPYYVVVTLKQSPLFDNFRTDRDFIRIKSEIEQKYYTERKRIEKIIARNKITYTFNLKGSVTATSL